LRHRFGKTKLGTLEGGLRDANLSVKAKKQANPRKAAARRKGAPVSKIMTRKSAKRQKPPKLPGPAKRKPRSAGSELPDILFEGDFPGSQAAGPGERLVLGASAPEEHFVGEGELPDAYGTKQILVAPRDPHWLYVHWDLTREQLRQYNAQSIHSHLVLRLSRPDQKEVSAGEVHVHPESRHWFVHVAEAGAKYAVELGYYTKAKGWTSISTSAPAFVPPDVVSGETSVQFATIPTEVALSRLVDIVKKCAGDNVSLAHAIEDIRLAGHPELPPVTNGDAARAWTPAQERAMAEIISVHQFGGVNVGSIDIAELVRRELQNDFSSVMAALAGPGGRSSISSPHGGAPAGPGGFWFKVNAEVIIYGATEPDAHVTIGGCKITLRPDGSFSCRFALPDGRYELPITAVSAADTEACHASLQFSRATNAVGDVGQHLQDPSLKTPTPENIS
jgi:hypothetical protein